MSSVGTATSWSSATSRVEEDWSNESLTELDWHAKYHAVTSSISSTNSSSSLSSSSNQADLWRLRELSLTPGGLLCPQLRKQVWPLLLSCHSVVFSRPCDSATTIVAPDEVDLEILQEDLTSTTSCIWNIQEQLMRSKQRQYELDEELRANQRQRHRSTQQLRSNSPRSVPTLCAVDSSSKDETDPPEDEEHDCCDFSKVSGPLPTLPENESVTSEESNSETLATTTQEEEETTMSAATFASTHQASDQEQKVLWNAIYSVLSRNQHHHYVRGLHQLAALLMINLESPSITSIALQQLATKQLRTALQDETAWRRQFADCFSQLLVELNQTNCSPNSTTPTWWWKDIPDIRVASRVLDVLLVSHSLMPVYLAVAATVTRTTTDRKTSSTAMVDEFTVEAVIAQALQYIKQFPPHVLFQKAGRTTNTYSQDSLQDEECIPASSDDLGTAFASLRSALLLESYPLARAAMGQAQNGCSPSFHQLKRWWKLLVAATVVALFLSSLSTGLNPPNAATLAPPLLERNESAPTLATRALTPDAVLYPLEGQQCPSASLSDEDTTLCVVTSLESQSSPQGGTFQMAMRLQEWFHDVVVPPMHRLVEYGKHWSSWVQEHVVLVVDAMVRWKEETWLPFWQDQRRQLSLSLQSQQQRLRRTRAWLHEQWVAMSVGLGWVQESWQRLGKEVSQQVNDL